MSRVLLRGITGQAGQILSEIFRTEGYDLYGLTHTRKIQPDKISIYKKVFYWDGFDKSELSEILKFCSPDIVYNLAAAHNSSEENLLSKDILLQVNFFLKFL